MPMPSFPEARSAALVAIVLAASLCASAEVPLQNAPTAEKIGTIAVPAGRSGTVDVPVTVDRTAIDISGAGNPHSVKVLGR